MSQDLHCFHCTYKRLLKLEFASELDNELGRSVVPKYPAI